MRVSLEAGIFGHYILKYPAEKLISANLSMWRIKRGIETDNVIFAMFTGPNPLRFSLKEIYVKLGPLPKSPRFEKALKLLLEVFHYGPLNIDATEDLFNMI